MKTQLTSALLLGMLTLTISNCSLLPKQSAALHDFGYPYANIPSETDVLSQQSSITVEAPKWLVDSRMRYRQLYAAPTQVRFYSLDRWIAPPSELFEQLLNNKGKHWPNPVFIELQIFEQQFDSPDKAKVVMHFTATIMHDDKKHHHPKRNFNLQMPCPTPDAKGAVTGFTALTKEVVDKVEAWLTNAN
jgi:cholesterol transport system auxiliary component